MLIVLYQGKRLCAPPLSKVTTNRANKAEALKEIGDQTAFFAEKHLNLR